MPVKPHPNVRRMIPLASKPPERYTAAEHMKTQGFKDRCEALDVEPTKRQARKCLAKTGRWGC